MEVYQHIGSKPWKVYIESWQTVLSPLMWQ